MTYLDTAILNSVWIEAKEAAHAAAKIQDERIGIPETQRGLDCGFAWVVIKPAKGAFVAYLKKLGIGSLHHPSGWSIWYSKLHEVNTQSITVHQAAARAAAQVLVKHGINAQAQSRLD